MAVLTNEDRVRIWRGVMRYWSVLRETIGVTKADLRAAINAADDWLDSNAASYNSALPQPFRGSATSGQKALLLAVTALMRYGGASVVKGIIGEVD